MLSGIKSQNRELLVWWTTNTRAASVIVARALDLEIPVNLVADPSSALPSEDILSRCKVLYREKSPIDLGEFENTILQIRLDRSEIEFVLAPTSEYLNDHLSDQSWARKLSEMGLIFPVVADIEYRTLSSKRYQTEYFRNNPVFPTPKELSDLTDSQIFVLKPRSNVHGNQTLTPIIVDGKCDFSPFVFSQEYFMQEFVDPPSIYWCGYRNSAGEVTAYLQQNLVQCIGGKSMALAVRLDPSHFTAVISECERFLSELHYRGPIMFEFRGEDLKFIEINPRFWGPLLLDKSTGFSVLDSFFKDWFSPKTLLKFQSKIFEEFGDIYIVPSYFDGNVALDVLEPDFERTINSLGPVLEKYKKVVHQIGGDW